VQNDETEQLLNEIGQLLSEDVAYRRHNTLLHAELDVNYVAPSIFTDLGDHIVNRDADRRLDYALLDLWGAQDSDKRWREIEYLLRGDKFEVNFTYPEEVDPEEDSLDRRDRIVERYFGKKPIDYPPPPDNAMKYKH